MKPILVFIDLNHKTLPVGRLWAHNQRVSFDYHDSWLENHQKFALEPALQLTTGTFHTREGLSLFGAIGDSAPDRWGRVLMQRAHMADHQNNSHKPRTLQEIDYLLGVNDEARQGALRFARSDEPHIFVNPQDHISIPPLIQLPKLLSASEGFIEDPRNTGDLKLLLAPGSSLGGARPKACVRDQSGHLSIAKFPHKNDDANVVTWEAVALTLAKQAGLNTPSWVLKNIADKPVLIVRRFDRAGSGRIPFLSAMSLLGAKDNEPHTYLDLAYAIGQHSPQPKADLHELWRRIVFTVMISNTDDHLRNHGFLYTDGWRLSPVYDINPTPRHIKSKILSTAIDFNTNVASLEVALSVAEDFRLSLSAAKDIIINVRNAVKQWRTVATQMGLSKPEQDDMASAFSDDDGLL